MILALDLGLKTGWALGSKTSGLIASGVWLLQTPSQARFEGGGMRWVRLRQKLAEIGSPSLVAVEEVRRHAGTNAAHAYGGALATVTSWCEEREIPYQAFGVGTLKKHATGKGNASKQQMIAAAEARGWTPADDNEADAQWLLDLALQELHVVGLS